MGCFQAQNVDRLRGGHRARHLVNSRLLRLAPPHPSPHVNKPLIIILQTSLTANLRHAHLRGRFHGDGQDASTFPSAPQQ
jgi:hypothetical protein